MKKIGLFLSLIVSTLYGFSQTPTQTIRATVIDKDSKAPLAQVTVLLDKTNIVANTDSNGIFVLQNVAVGRHQLQVSLVGYKPQYISDIQVNAAKEIILTIELEE